MGFQLPGNNHPKYSSICLPKYWLPGHVFHTNTYTHTDLDMVVITMALDRCSGSTVFNGSDVMLTCSIPNAFPSPTIFWYHNTNNVAESPNSNIMFSSDGYILTISRIFPNQSGQWVCEVSNAAGTRRSEPTTLMVDCKFFVLAINQASPMNKWKCLCVTYQAAKPNIIPQVW